MNSSNSFNICPRCGNSNSLNAKYCSRCGAQLKVPTEAVVCHKCHTRNSSLANFCRNCGATLKVGAQTKICPRCGREIGAEENMCACGYSFVTMQQTEPKRADVSSTNKDKKKDKKRDKSRAAEVTYTDTPASTEKKPKQKKSGRGFALFAFIILAVFVVALILPASARGPLVNFDKGFYHPAEETTPAAAVDKSANLAAEGEETGGENTDIPTEPATPETWTVTFKNGEDVVATVTVNKGEKLTAEQIPATPAVAEGKEFKGWFNGETEITVETEIASDITATAKIEDAAAVTPEPTPDPEPVGKLEANVYGWDLFKDIFGIFSAETKAEMSAYEGGSFKYIVNEYFGTSTFMMVVMFAVFILTAFFHLLVCIVRIIAPNRSKRPNYLYLALAVITTILVAMMMLAHFIPDENNGFRLLFQASYKGLTCEYGLVLILIPVYYWFFWLYSYIAKKKTPKKSKKAE